MKKKKMLPILLGMIMILSSCGVENWEEGTKAETIEENLMVSDIEEEVFVPTNDGEKIIEEFLTSDLPMGIESEIYVELLNESIVSTGNNYRMKKVIEKLRSGENVYIAAIGGSVTEGVGPEDFKDGYAFTFFRKLKEEFTDNDGANVYFDCAGLSGTPSELGLLRY